jgi:hypothetical protein
LNKFIGKILGGNGVGAFFQSCLNLSDSLFPDIWKFGHGLCVLVDFLPGLGNGNGFRLLGGVESSILSFAEAERASLEGEGSVGPDGIEGRDCMRVVSDKISKEII